MPDDTTPRDPSPVMPVLPPAPLMTPPRRSRWSLILGVLVVLAILFSGVGFVTATALENQDTFCISCHTVPETTYYNRAYIALDNPNNPTTVTDLATAHYHLSQQNGKTAFACIDCHRGDASNILDRVAAIALGAKDSGVWALGKQDPAIEKPADTSGIWLTDAACISCHTDTLLNVNGFTNHYHTRLPETAQLVASGRKFVVDTSVSSLNQQAVLSAWAVPVDVPLSCSSCHQAHQTMINGAASQFVNQQTVLIACQECHKAAGQGPQDLTSASTSPTAAAPKQ